MESIKSVVITNNPSTSTNSPSIDSISSGNSNSNSNKNSVVSSLSSPPSPSLPPNNSSISPSLSSSFAISLPTSLSFTLDMAAATHRRPLGPSEYVFYRFQKNGCGLICWIVNIHGTLESDEPITKASLETALHKTVIKFPALRSRLIKGPGRSPFTTTAWLEAVSYEDYVRARGPNLVEVEDALSSTEIAGLVYILIQGDSSSYTSSSYYYCHLKSF